MGTEPQSRRDAVENRKKILSAARIAVAEAGAEVGIGEIAQRAGVAVGTLYRHFPTKADLIAAAAQQHMPELAEEVARAVDKAAGGESPGRLLSNLFREFVESSARNRVLKETARALGRDPHSGTDAEHRVAELLEELLHRAQEAGEASPGLTVGDVYLLLSTMPTDESAMVRARWANLVLPALILRHGS